MAVITTGTHPKALWPGVKSWYGGSYTEHPVEYTDLFEQETSMQAYEEIVEHTGFGLAPVKAEGAGVSYDTETQGVTTRFTHVAYALGFICTYEEKKFNLYEKVGKRRARRLAFSMRQTEENLGANIYNRAHNGSYVGGDGKVLCATDHGSLSGSQSNRLATAADMSEAVLEDMCIQVMGATNNRGLKIGLTPRSLHVPRQLWFESHRILKSTLQNDTAQNALNVLRSTNALPGGIKMNHYFTDPDAVFIRTNCPDSLTWFWAEKPGELQQDNDFDTKNAKACDYMLCSMGWGDFRGLYSNGGGG